MRNLRSTALLGGALSLGLAFGAPAADIDTSKRIHVAMVPKLVGLSVFKANEKGAKAAAKKLNIDFLYTGPVTASAQGQVDVFNSLIARTLQRHHHDLEQPDRSSRPALRRAMQAGHQGRVL